MNRVATEYGHTPQHPEAVSPLVYEDRLRAIVHCLTDLGVPDVWVSHSTPTDHIIHHTGRLPRGALRALQTPTVFPWCDTRIRPFRRSWGSRERHQWTISILLGFYCDVARPRERPLSRTDVLVAMAGAPMLSGMGSADRNAALRAIAAAVCDSPALCSVEKSRPSPQEVFREELDRLGLEARLAMKATDIVFNPDHE